MFVGAAGNLGPVCDEDHLTHGGQIFKSVRKAVQGQAAHAGVDFIEDEGGILGGGHNAGESQQETGELAARSDAVQGLRRLTGVGSPENADLFVHYAGPELGADIFGNDPHAFGKAETSELIFQFPGEGFAGCAAFGPEFFGYGFKFRGEGIDIVVYLFDIERARVEKVNLLLDFRPEGQDLGKSAVHPALQLGELEEPLFHGVEVCRHVVRNRGMPERSRKVVQFLDEAVHGFRAGSEARVAFRHAFEQAVKAGRHVQEARRIAISIEHVQGRLVVLACLFGAAGAHVLELDVLVFLRFDLVDLLLPQFKQITHFDELRLPGLDFFPFSELLFKLCLQAVALLQKFRFPDDLLHELILEGGLKELLLAVLARVGDELFPEFLRVFLGLHLIVDVKTAAS